MPQMMPHMWIFIFCFLLLLFLLSIFFIHFFYLPVMTPPSSPSHLNKWTWQW